MSDWLSINEAAGRLHLTAHQVLEMAVSGRLASRLVHDHREVAAAAVEAYLAEQADHLPDPDTDYKAAIEDGEIA